MPPVTHMSIYAIVYLHSSIFLCHNSLWPKALSKILCASDSLSTTVRFYGAGRLSSSISIPPSAQTLITSPYHIIPILSIVYTISFAFCRSSSSIPPSSSYKPNMFSLGTSWFTLQYLQTAWNSTSIIAGEKKRTIAGV